MSTHHIVQKNHMVWIDLLRSFAICCVILVHVTENVYPFTLEYMTLAGIRTKMFAFALFTIGRLGVPIFFFISGYLLLDREYDLKKSVRFWKNNLLGLLLTTEIWIVLYNIFLAVFHDYGFHIDVLIKNMLFMKTTDISHMWYMNRIIGLYIFLPFIAIVLQKIDLKMLRMPLIVSMLCLFVVPIINVLLLSQGQESIWYQLDIGWSGGVYGIMMILGFFVKKGYFKDLRKKWLYLFFFIGFAASMALQLFCCGQGYLYKVWYDCAFLLIASFSIFVLCSVIQRIPLPSIFNSLAKCSFGIYLVHNPIVMVLNRYLYISHNSIKVAVISVLSLGISWLIVNTLSRWKKAAKILFFIK